jgi:hypothetical protein
VFNIAATQIQPDKAPVLLHGASQHIQLVFLTFPNSKTIQNPVSAHGFSKNCIVHSAAHQFRRTLIEPKGFSENTSTRVRDYTTAKYNLKSRSGSARKNAAVIFIQGAGAQLDFLETWAGGFEQLRQARGRDPIFRNFTHLVARY